MSQDDAADAVTCTLSEDEVPERTERVRSLLRAHYEGFEETEAGLAIRFRGTDEAPTAVAEFVSNELQCCSFADYEISVARPYDETVLTVTGPEGTREMFREGLVDRLEAESTTNEPETPS